MGSDSTVLKLFSVPGRGWDELQRSCAVGPGLASALKGHGVTPCPAALQLLLKDPAPMVRGKAAETLGRLVKFA